MEQDQETLPRGLVFSPCIAARVVSPFSRAEYIPNTAAPMPGMASSFLSLARYVLLLKRMTDENYLSWGDWAAGSDH